jgi:hypothetical protein
MMTPRQAAEALIAILTRENAALSAMDLTNATALLAGKQAATEALVQSGDVSSLDRDTAERLRALARENQVLLERALTVQGRVITLIAGAGAGEQAPRYGAAGRLAAVQRIAPRALSARA